MSVSPENIKGQLVLNVKMTVKPGRGDELLPWITRLKAQVAEEKGQTLEYTWARDAPNGDVFVVWERYASVDAWKTHTSTETLKSFLALDLFAQPVQVHFYEGEIGAH